MELSTINQGNSSNLSTTFRAFLSLIEWDKIIMKKLSSRMEDITIPSRLTSSKIKSDRFFWCQVEFVQISFKVGIKINGILINRVVEFINIGIIIKFKDSFQILI